MAITYKELRDHLNAMPEERLADNVTIFDGITGECIPAGDFGAIEKMDQQGDVGGVLDDGHFVIKTCTAPGVEDLVGKTVFVEFNVTTGRVCILSCEFVRMIDRDHAAVIIRDDEGEVIVELADIYLGEYDERSLADLLLNELQKLSQ